VLRWLAEMPGQRRKTPEPQFTFAYRTGEILSPCVNGTTGDECGVKVEVSVLDLSHAAKAVGHADFQEWSPPLQVQLMRAICLHRDWLLEIQAFALKLGHMIVINGPPEPPEPEQGHHE
jgi:hypothetical protein